MIASFSPNTAARSVYKDLKDKGFEILDFPCNQFAKINVNGDDAEPLFAYLATEKSFAGFGKSLKTVRAGLLRDSNPNIERLIKMDAKGMIYPQVWKNYCAFPATYRRIRVAYLYGYIQCRCCSVH